MLIVGCDFHTRYQQIAMMDTETGELVERRLEHENGEARAFFANLASVRLAPGYRFPIQPRRWNLLYISRRSGSQNGNLGL